MINTIHQISRTENNKEIFLLTRNAHVKTITNTFCSALTCGSVSHNQPYKWGCKVPSHMSGKWGELSHCKVRKNPEDKLVQARLFLWEQTWRQVLCSFPPLSPLFPHTQTPNNQNLGKTSSCLVRGIWDFCKIHYACSLRIFTALYCYFSFPCHCSAGN